MKNWCYCNSVNGHKIDTNFNTYQESTAVMPFAKFCNNLVIGIWIKGKKRKFPSNLNWDGKLSYKSCNEFPGVTLTHWGRVTHICISKLTIIGSDNGLSPDRRQAIIWTNDGILSIWPPGTNISEMLSEMLSEIHTFSFKKIHFKMSSGKWRPCWLSVSTRSDIRIVHITLQWLRYDTDQMLNSQRHSISHCDRQEVWCIYLGNADCTGVDYTVGVPGSQIYKWYKSATIVSILTLVISWRLMR